MLVVRQRVKTNIEIGDGGNEDLVKAIRVHANNVETVPMALIAIGVLESVQAAALLIHGLGITLTIARLLHAFGLTSTTGRSPGRFLGTIATWLVYLIGGGTCLYYGASSLF